MLQSAIDIAAEAIASAPDRAWVEVPKIRKDYLDLLTAEDASDCEPHDEEHGGVKRSVPSPPRTPQRAAAAAAAAKAAKAMASEERMTRSNSDLLGGTAGTLSGVTDHEPADCNPEIEARAADNAQRRFRGRITDLLRAGQALGRHEGLEVVEGAGGSVAHSNRRRYYLAAKGARERCATLKHASTRAAQVSELEAVVEVAGPARQSKQDMRDTPAAALVHASEVIRASKPVTPEYWRRHMLNELDVDGISRTIKGGAVALTRAHVIEKVEDTLRSAKREGLVYSDITESMEDGSIFSFAWNAFCARHRQTTQAMLSAKVGGKAISAKDRPVTHLQSQDISLASAYDQVGSLQHGFFYRSKHPVTEEVDADGNPTGIVDVPSREFICNPGNRGKPLHTRAIQALNAAAVSLCPPPPADGMVWCGGVVATRAPSGGRANDISVGATVARQ